jgi:hypothetical protein
VGVVDMDTTPRNSYWASIYRLRGAPKVIAGPSPG